MLLDGNTFANLTGATPTSALSANVFVEPEHENCDPVSYLRKSFTHGDDAVQSFQLAFVNVTNEQTTLKLTVDSTLWVSAVPDPSTYLMLGAGLAVCAVARRRKRSGNA